MTEKITRRKALKIGTTAAVGAAIAPHAWLSLFDSDPVMLDAGTRYVQTVGPFYGLFGLGLALYFASQGAGRLLWPLLANLTRLAIAGGGGWLALRWSGDLSYVFVAQGAALAAFGVIIAAAVAGGAWFGRPSWSWWARHAVLPVISLLSARGRTRTDLVAISVKKGDVP